MTEAENEPKTEEKPTEVKKRPKVKFVYKRRRFYRVRTSVQNLTP